jgi:dTDP-4-amino-4,6-dideoxygalactose transaminase
MYLINHGESVVHDEGGSYPVVGYNLRMTEIQAALINSQLKRLDENIRIRRENVSYLNERLGKILGIRPGKADEIGTHSYYCAPYHFERGDIHRDKFIDAVRFELQNCRINTGYIKPLYRFPFYGRNLNLTTVERMWRDELFLIMDIAYPHSLADMKDIADAFEKVAENANEL